MTPTDEREQRARAFMHSIPFDGTLEQFDGAVQSIVSMLADTERATLERVNEGELWSFIRTLLSQGCAIQQDYQAGKYETYEHYSARLDEAARERVDQFMAKLKEIPS